MNPSTRPDPSHTRPGRVGWCVPEQYPSTRPDPSIGTGRTGTGLVHQPDNHQQHIQTRPAGRVRTEGVVTTMNPQDVICPWCRAPVGAPCGPARRAPHAARTRLAAVAEAHQPVQWRDGQPVATPVSLSGVHDQHGHRTMRVVCPICWRQHTHGWDATEDTAWTHRVAHCHQMDGPGGYWIPPTVGLPRSNPRRTP